MTNSLVERLDRWLKDQDDWLDNGSPTISPAPLSVDEIKHIRDLLSTQSGETGLVCSGCGSTDEIEDLRQRGFISCCPERKMQPAAPPSQTRIEALENAGRDALDTLEKLRADLEEDDDDMHAQRIAVLALSIARTEAALQPQSPSLMGSEGVKNWQDSPVLDQLGDWLESQPVEPSTVRDDALEEAAKVAERLADEGDAYERSCGGWDDPAIKHPRSWANPRGEGQRLAASAIRALRSTPTALSPTIAPPDPVARQMAEALREAVLQLEYLDGKYQTGTTPAIIARLNAALEGAGR